MTEAGAKRSGFDRIARVYRWLEYSSFGPLLMRCRRAQLARMTHCRRALLLGDGDGRFAARLLEANHAIHIVALDESAAMLAQLTRRAQVVGGASRVTTRQGEVVERLPIGSMAGSLCGFDLVVSHFFLDCLSTEDVACVAADVKRALVPGGEWIISEFEAVSMPARLLVALLYKGFGVLTGLETQRMPAYREALCREGWHCVAEIRFARGLLSSTVWQLRAADDQSLTSLNLTRPV